MNSNQLKILSEDCNRVLQDFNDSVLLEKLDRSVFFIPGGTGFIGSWVSVLLDFISKQFRLKIKVYILSRDPVKYQERFGHYSSDFHFLRGDLCELTEIPRDVNYIINAAAIPDNRFFMSYPIEAMTTIGVGTSALFKASTLLPDLRKIIHLSSGSIYGSQDNSFQTISEQQMVVGGNLNTIKESYIEAKRFAEMLCVAARNEFRLPISIVRPFTFIGPFQSLDAPWAINNFINDGLAGRPIRVLSDGQVVRGYLYGADAGFWLIKLLLTSPKNDVYNLGNSEGLPLIEIANRVAKCFQPTPEIYLNASLVPQASVQRYLPDVNKLLKECNVKQYTDIDCAISQTISWYSKPSGTHL